MLAPFLAALVAAAPAPADLSAPVASDRSGAVAYLRAAGARADLFVVRGGRTTRVGPAVPSGPAAAWSPDGRSLAYRDQRSRLVVFGPSGRRIVEPLPFVDRFAWSPRGDRIAYLVRSAAGADMRTVRVDGSQRRTVTFDGDILALTWSPDARTLAFIGVAQLGFSDVVEDLRVAGTDGGKGAMTFRSAASLEATCCLAWSRAGLVYAIADRVEGVPRSPVAYRTKAPWRGDPGTRLTDGFPIAFSPQGRLLAQRGDRVLVLDASGRIAAQLVGTDPSWSPSGDRLLLHRGGRIVVVRPDGRSPRVVATGRDAAWTGRNAIVFQRAGCGAGAGIHSVVIGAQPRRLAAAAC
jgi:dipeptidyl aminopeptidase/acylaminoacyl peptidase